MNSSSLVWWSQTLVHTHVCGCGSGYSLVDLTGKASEKWSMELLWDALVFFRKSLQSCLILCMSVPISWKRCPLCPRTVGVHCLLVHECGLYSEYSSGLSLYSPTMQSKNSHLQTWLIFSPYDWVCWSGCDSMSVPTTWKGYLLCPQSVGVHCLLVQGVWALYRTLFGIIWLWSGAEWELSPSDWGAIPKGQCKRMWKLEVWSGFIRLPCTTQYESQLLCMLYCNFQIYQHRSTLPQ